uniref:Rubisco LSMT substrate-binding domain-containing protein n=1 Tax=Haptolina ericina TaxID=156174 RepID=A0A7S3EUU4_9EUKA|mmetsp:Transcript_26031/g.59119  ORF Transcript_26031/g.59119 Transcript_26031/m.59119 type:complete len:249 (+) Transcript_26031:81-827(+)|eukprot:CAMPEP_0181206724 /NCGR_PEP_ID=MMETSP1096-20121128/21190_1 /TAXON_ID=156174 ORGANISM="Chrysochromulina ericina, Strain CCMP281" /NCGR_SAMPLE_ID=MMETSP1096 /ASSEMBLY_ACC=CAM_ASM_000453 /LENGTH=248 /DNA_ID=CAMNT_0023297647 /DNA_START=12 /DNA_END=758 /DNA_ORIENTATION=+
MGLGGTLSQERFEWAVEAVCSRAFTADISGDVRALGLSVIAAGVGVASFLLDGTAGGQGSIGPATLCALAVSCFSTVWQLWYALSGSGLTYVMCPVIDSMNHRSTGSKLSSLAYSSLVDAFTATAEAAIPAGDQIYISYGEGKDNDAFLMHYGFVERGNPAQQATLALPADAGGGTFRLGRAGTVGTQASLPRDTMRQACMVELQGMPTSIQWDQQLLEVGDLSTRCRLAVEWRLERKLLLEAWCADR